MASKSTKGEILAKFFDDGEYTALFADGAVSAASGYAAGQQAYAVFQNGEAVSVKDVEKNIKVLELAAQTDRKSTRLNSSHNRESRMPSSA